MSRLIVAPVFPTEPHWPVTVRYGRVLLTPFRVRDLDEIARVRVRNASWLTPWDPTPPAGASPVGTARERTRYMWQQAREGLALPWIIRWDEAGRQPAIGQCTVSGIVYGSAMAGAIGYWVDRRYAGRSITPVAVAMATDYAMKTLGLHRIEICIRPENRPSLRVVEKLGFRYEGRRLRYIHIAGDWRDHEVFALTAEEVPQGLLARVPRSAVQPDGEVPRWETPA